MIPASASDSTSIQVMVPPFSSLASGAFSAETVDVQVVRFSSSTTYLSNTIGGLTVSVLPPVPNGVPAGAMTSELLSSSLNISATVQNVTAGTASLSNLSAALAQMNTDLSPLISAANTIAATPTQSVNLITANGTTTVLNAKTLAQSDQLAQALIAAVVKQGSIPVVRSSSGCPAASGDTTFDNQVCSAQIYFQTYASQVSDTTASRHANSAAAPALTITPPDKAAMTLFANLALGGIAEFCEPAGGAVIYSLVAAPIVTSTISSLAVNQETPTGTDLVQGVGLNFLDQAIFNKVPVLGTSVDLVNAFGTFVNYSPPTRGILLSSGVATLLPGGETFLDPNTSAASTLLKIPSTPQGGSFDTTTLVVSPASAFTLTSGTSGSGSGSIKSFPTGASFPAGTIVELTAVPSTGSTFAGWSGACSGTGACKVTMSSNQSVTATFNLTIYDLTLSMTGSGRGTITPSPEGTGCGTNCHAYASGTAVQLTATPSSGDTFAGWSGACEGTGTCTLTMSRDQKVTASFGLPTPPPSNLTGTWTGSFAETVVWDTGTCSFAGTATLPLT